MTFDANLQPMVRQAHSIPVTMQERVKAELERMQSIVVITLVTEPTEWLSSMVARNQTLYQSQRPQHRIEKTPPPNAQHGRGGSANVRGNSFFCSGCKELFLADTSRQQIITADHIQHPIWVLQIPSDALWH